MVLGKVLRLGLLWGFQVWLLSSFAPETACTGGLLGPSWSMCWGGRFDSAGTLSHPFLGPLGAQVMQLHSFTELAIFSLGFQGQAVIFGKTKVSAANKGISLNCLQFSTIY